MEGKGKLRRRNLILCRVIALKCAPLSIVKFLTIFALEGCGC